MLYMVSGMGDMIGEGYTFIPIHIYISWNNTNKNWMKNHIKKWNILFAINIENNWRDIIKNINIIYKLLKYSPVYVWSGCHDMPWDVEGWLVWLAGCQLLSLHKNSRDMMENRSRTVWNLLTFLSTSSVVHIPGCMMVLSWLVSESDYRRRWEYKVLQRGCKVL